MSDNTLLVVPAGTADERLDSVAWMKVFFETLGGDLDFAFEDERDRSYFITRVVHWRAVQGGNE